MAPGPTQNYDDATLGRWQPHPVLALAVRSVLLALPVVFTVGFGVAAARWFGPARLGVPPWAWLATEIAAATALLLGTTRALAHLMPLTTLLRLSLFFPDAAPSRVGLALRSLDPRRGRRSVAADDSVTAALTSLVTRLGEHDQRTQEHSRRVQAYATLIAQQLGLSDHDTARLGWAALLHDVGKVRVPTEILNRAGRPTDEEWEVLTQHPVHGAALVAPLAAWLGDWVDAVAEHHERWDGAGYPRAAAGTGISLGGRIVAVADAFDVITSARPYKRPLSAAAAREELTRCAGTQFDPGVVRAFLAVGLRPVRRVTGPASLLAGLPGLGSLPLPTPAAVTGAMSTAVTTTVAAGVAATVGAVLTVVAPSVTGLGMAAALGATEPVRDLVATAVPDPAAVASAPETLPAPVAEEVPAAEGVAGVLVAPPGADADPADAPAGPPAGDEAPTAPPSDPSTPAPSGPSVPSEPPAPDEPSAPGEPPPPGEPPAPPEPPASGPDAPPTSPPPGGGPAAEPPSGDDLPPADPPASPACATARGGGPVDLDGADLTGCDLRGLQLNGAQLAGATLTDVDLRGARLQGADLAGATLTRVRADGATLTGADLSHAHVADSSLAGASLDAADLVSVVLRGTSLEDAVLTSADLAWADLTGAVLAHADLSHAQAERAVLAGADLRGALLVQTRLDHASLVGSRLDGADLTRADLTDADLTGATGTPASTTDARWQCTVCASGTRGSTSCY